MKKIILAIAVLSVFFLFGCESNPDDPNPNNPPTNQAPTANAGTDFEHNITTSGTTVTLNGSGTDTDGTITGYAWTCTDKPNGSAAPTFSNSAVANPTVSGFDTLGDYEFSLKVKDNENAESTADVVKVSLCMTASKNVEVKFTAFVAGATLDLTPTYTPAIDDGDVVYILTDDKENTWNRTTGFIVNVSDGPYANFSVPVFTQIFEDRNGNELDRQVIKAVLAVSTFGSLRDTDDNTISAIPSIDITLSKKVTAGAITTALDTTVEFVEFPTLPNATIDFSPSTDLPSGVTYIVTDDRTPPNKWELGKDGFNGKVTASLPTGEVTLTQTFYLYGEEITGIDSQRTVKMSITSTLGNTRFATLTSDSGSVTLKYPPSESPEYETITKDITVSFPALVSGGTTLDFTPTYTPAIAGGGFEDSDVVYTVTNDKTDDVLSGTDFVISSSSFSVGAIVFTQTFKDKNGTEIATQDVTTTRGPASNFMALVTVPVDLHLSKQVEKK